MKAAVTGVLWVFLAVPLCGAPEPQGAPEEGCTLAGVVVKSTTGAPLKRAVVYLQRIEAAANNEQHSLRTDAGGRFSFSGLRPGSYSLWVNRDGYLNIAYGQETPDSPPKPVSLKPGERKTDLVFRLIPLGDIVGHVYDEDGEAVSGVSIQALRRSYLNGRRQFVTTASTSSDDLGAYRLARLTPGEYFVSATYNDPAPTDQGTPVSYVPVYYAGTTDPSGAQSIRIGTEQELPDVDFTLVPVRAVSVRGKATNTAGWTLPGLNVGLLRRDFGMFSYQGNAGVDAQGNFELRGVPPGSYVLNVQYYDRGTQYSGRQTVQVGGADVDGVELLLGPGSEVKGFVRIEGKSDFSATGLQVQLNPREQIQMGAQPATVQADGSFALGHVADGPYLVNLCCPPPNYYLKAAHWGSEDALTDGLTLNQAQSPSSLELVLSPAGAQVEGVVLNDEKPADSAVVVLVPDANHRGQTGQYPVTGINPEGRFTLTSVPPGEYTLFAWDKADNGAYMDPEFLHPYERSGKSLHVEEGSKLSVQLDLIHSRDSDQ
jgi:hypothetical protein